MSNMKQLRSLFVAFTKESLRNRMEVFFNILFPLILLILFGTFFGTPEVNRLRVGIYIEQSGGLSIDNFAEFGFEAEFFDSRTNLLESMDARRLDLAIEVKNDEIIFSYLEGNISKTSQIKMLEHAIKAVLEKKVNGVEDVISLNKIPVSVGRVKSDHLNYLMAGIIAISLLSSGMFSVINLFGRYQEQGVLKRIVVAPINPFNFVIGSTLTRFLISFLSVLIIMFSNNLIFHSQFDVYWPAFIVTVISSTLGMMALGVLLVIIFKSSGAAESAGVLMVFMVFLAGVYFPVSFLPKYFLMRFVVGVESMSMSWFIVTNLVLAGAGIVLLYLAGKKFLGQVR
ncbi:MAG: type transport system permease protein [Kosmotoga sp.]|nr:type transport system permease protein [Kosmotoga sp.]